MLFPLFVNVSLFLSAVISNATGKIILKIAFHTHVLNFLSSIYLFFFVRNLHFLLNEIHFKCSSGTSYFFSNSVVCDKIL